MQLGAPDHRILRELARDGRLSNVELARRVRMSESACLRRARALEDMGAIAGYRATINPRAYGKVELPTVRDVVTCLSLRTYKTASDVGPGI
ncbi:MAG: winged helix-turn-helix transcriptional regulator [Steroidobacteraceae bacterium]|jgi:DNA-binding Lrp family transcriptional regulator